MIHAPAPVLYVAADEDAARACSAAWPAVALAAIIFDPAVANPLAAARSVRAACSPAHA